MWDFFGTVNDLIVEGMDYVLGWILYLPRDVRLFVVAIMTSAILTFVRLLTTDQEWLRRAAADQKRLKQLIRQARADGDKAARKRFKQTRTLIKVKSLRFEGKPLLAALIPVVLLATWSFGRLAFEPPQAGEAVTVRLHVPRTAIGNQYAYIVPEPGLTAETGWVRRAESDTPAEVHGAWDAANAWINDRLELTPPLEGKAEWQLKPVGDRQRYVLKIRYRGKTIERELLVGSRKYATAFEMGDGQDVLGTELAMKPVKLFGVVGGIDCLLLPGWLVAYLLIAIPFVTIIKHLFRIY